jgi:hypothetical protein
MPEAPGSASITRVAPLAAIDGGVILIEGEHLPCDPPPRVTIGDAEARVVSASPRHLRVIVPDELDGGELPLRVDAVTGGSVRIQIGVTLATGVHQVDNPVFDRRDGVREPLRVDIPNPTSLAIARDGALYVSSRFEGSVYRVDPATLQCRVFATALGSPFGLAFDQDGYLWVGDRSGSIFRIDHDGVASRIADLPPSVAAFHLAAGPDGHLYVSVPTLSPRDCVYRVSPDGQVETAVDGLGRPQGLAFDRSGVLHVVDALAGAAGVWRCDLAAGTRTQVLAAGSIVGLAFDPLGGWVAAGADRLWRIG